MSRRPADPRVAVAYVRVSTDTERQALGAEAQKQAIQRWADAANVTIAAWHVEEVSGGAPLEKRPILLAALADVAARGAGQLVVAKLDRFSRDPLSAALAEVTLRKAGACLAVADGAGAGSDPSAVLVRDILLATAKHEKAVIGARIRAALAVKKGRGELTGKAPYGMRVVAGVGLDGRPVAVLAPDEAERATLATLRALRADGLTLRAVVAEAAAMGIVGRTGKPLALRQVARALASAA